MNLSRLPPAERKRIRMETEILAELNHDHIINFYHVWENKEKGQCLERHNHCARMEMRRNESLRIDCC